MACLLNRDDLWCKYKEILCPMYRYLGMGAASEAVCLQGSHITCEDLVK